MFKPGTRIEKVKLWDGNAQIPLGTLATASHRPADFPGHDQEAILDDGERVDIACECWRPLDDNDPSSLTLDQILRTPLKETA